MSRKIIESIEGIKGCGFRILFSSFGFLVASNPYNGRDLD